MALSLDALSRKPHGSASDAGHKILIRPISDITHARRVCAALQRELPARAAVGTMRGGPTYVERATEGTGCLPVKLERAIACMRLIAGRTARPPFGISVICERCLHRWLLSCSRSRRSGRACQTRAA